MLRLVALLLGMRCFLLGGEHCVHCSYTVIVSLVCVAFGFVAVLVCAAFLLVTAVICVVWFILVELFCVLWIIVLSPVSWFCWSHANGAALFQLTDGTIFLNEGSSDGRGTRSWWKLTPNNDGSYIDGSWSKAADSINARTYFSSAVLADGRLVVFGGNSPTNPEATAATTRTSRSSARSTTRWRILAIDRRAGRLGKDRRRSLLRDAGRPLLPRQH